MSTNKPALCVVDDDADLRAALKLLMKSEGIPFVGFGSAEEFLEGLAEKNIGCILLDVRLPGMTGTELLEKIRTQNIYIPVILLTGHADVPLTVTAMKAGAADVLQKPFRDQTLIERVKAGLAKWDYWKKFQSERQMVAPKVASLTRREVQVVDLMVAGVKNRTIAAQLGISTKTLDIHRANIMRKFGTKTIADLVRWRMVDKAERTGLLPMLSANVS
ncbi:MAG: response regulator [Gemmataceae bacterium]|nr:response regulator [Gemmataceae bacterium]